MFSILHAPKFALLALPNVANSLEFLGGFAQEIQLSFPSGLQSYGFNLNQQINVDERRAEELVEHVENSCFA